jgi:uracil-DNA glycosylase
VSKSSKGIVFLAWGSPAQKRVDSIGVDKTKHCILRSVHPSPLSASRGFFECKHFIKANEWLRNRYGVEGEVEWDCLAEGKMNKGLPGNDQKKSMETKPVVAQVKETVKKDLKTKDTTTVLKKTLTVGDAKVQSTVGDEFDDEELDQLLSSEI